MMEFSVSSTILIIALISALIKLLIYHYKRLDLYRASNKIPGPRPVLPIIGNAHLFFGRPEDAINKIMKLLDNFKLSLMRAWLGHKFCVVLSDPEHVKIVLHSPKTIERDEFMKFLYPWLGTGLLTAPAKKWKVHRRLIMPTFHPRILESFIDTMNKQSEILVKVMESELNGNGLDVYSYISLCNFDIVCETVMGITTNVQTKENKSYPAILQKIMRILYHRMIRVWLHTDIIFNLTQLARDQYECIEYLHKWTNEVISQKRQQYSEQTNNKDDNKQTTGPRRKVFLDLLMELSNEGTKLTNKELQEEVDTMMVGAINTTAVVISFVLLILTIIPEIQEKCYEELVGIYGDKINEGRQIENKDLSRMEYLERVIKETMRLFPVAPLLIRQVSDDLDIGGGYTLPKDTTVILAVLKLHRSADIWDDPLSFNPDRFLPEQVAKRHPCAYIPFSAGPRNCIGLQYAMISMKIILATLLRNYIFIIDKYVKIEDIKIKSEIFIKAMNPITVKIKRR